MKRSFLLSLISLSLVAMDNSNVIQEKQLPKSKIEQKLQELLDREVYFRFRDLTDNGSDLEAQEGMFGRTLLMQAVMLDDIEAVKLFLRAGGQVNFSDNGGETPLIIAARDARVEMLPLLLDAGADINAQDNAGQTALMGAILKKDAQKVQLLLDYGADSDIRDNLDQTAFDVAIANGHHDIAEYLRNRKKKVR